MAKGPSRDTKTFRNPTGYWEHIGAFSIELTSDADKSIVPQNAEVQGDIVRVSNGRINQTIGGIQLYSGEIPFFWGYGRIKIIRNGNGDLLWVNYDYR